MIGKLKRKFILINMALIGFVLLVIFAVLIGTTWRQQESETQNALRMALEMRSDALGSRFPGLDPQMEPPEGGVTPLQPEQKDRLPNSSVFCVRMGSDDTVAEITRRNMTISDEDVNTAVRLARQDGAGEGNLTTLGLRYRTQETPDGLKIAFIDSTTVTSAMRALILRCALIFLLSLVLLFAVNLFLASWALKPVKLAWEQQRQFVADASHELKTPLTVILANMGLLLANPAQTVESQRKWVDNTQEEGLRMKKLVDDLLFLAKADSGRARAAKLPMDLSDAVWSGALPFESVAFEKKVEIETDIEPGITVTADEGQMRQAVAILMDNALKYAGENGKAAIRLHRQQSKAVLTVRNSGQPIPPEALPHLFERFYRADFARQRDVGGYGLGLSILETIVRFNGGRINVESTQETGTVFTLTFHLS